MKLNVLGGSGSGTTTLAAALAPELDALHIDADAYYWVPTDPPFRHKVPADARRARLQHDFDHHARVVISGSMVTWGSAWTDAFDLVVFLQIPAPLRMARLAERERRRYGPALDRDPDVAAHSREFMQWAECYDDPSFDGRSITQHETWMAAASCPVLRIEGDTTVAERVRRVLDALP